jgi:hypothetical protein
VNKKIASEVKCKPNRSINPPPIVSLLNTPTGVLHKDLDKYIIAYSNRNLKPTLRSAETTPSKSHADTTPSAKQPGDVVDIDKNTYVGSASKGQRLPTKRHYNIKKQVSFILNSEDDDINLEDKILIRG